MANHVLVTTFLPQERFEPKVIPPEKDNNYSIMIHHGEKDLVGLRMTKGQLVSLYAAIRGVLQGQEDSNVISGEPASQRTLL